MLRPLALLLLLTFSAGLCAEVIPLEFPRVWNGSKNKASDGNPAVVKGIPLWRLDRVWPDDYLGYANWTPLIWAGDKWEAPDHLHGGQPNASFNDSNQLVLSIRAAHTNEPGRKICALVLMIPTRATYGIAGKVHFKRWDGSGQANLLILRRDSAPSKRVVEIKKIPLPADGDAVIEPIMLELDAGQEIAFLPVQNQQIDAGNLTFTELKVAAKR